MCEPAAAAAVLPAPLHGKEKFDRDRLIAEGAAGEPVRVRQRSTGRRDFSSSAGKRRPVERFGRAPPEDGVQRSALDLAVESRPVTSALGHRRVRRVTVETRIS